MRRFLFGVVFGLGLSGCVFIPKATTVTLSGAEVGSHLFVEIATTNHRATAAGVTYQSDWMASCNGLTRAVISSMVRRIEAANDDNPPSRVIPLGGQSPCNPVIFRDGEGIAFWVPTAEGAKRFSMTFEQADRLREVLIRVHQRMAEETRFPTPAAWESADYLDQRN